MRILPALALLLFLGCATADRAVAPQAQQPPAPENAAAPGDIRLGECLVLPPVFRGTRSFVFTDPVEHRYVQGTLTPPKAGEAVTAPDGKEVKWEAAKADAEGELRHGSLAGGYLWWTVKSEVEEARVLVAQGHIGVYVNGEPRFGDPYSTGYVQLPVLMKKGENHFVFRAIRGFAKARLELVAPPNARYPAVMMPADMQLPDLVEGKAGGYHGAMVVANCGGSALKLGFSSVRADLAAGKLRFAGGWWSVQPYSTCKIPFLVHYEGEASDKPLEYQLSLEVLTAGGVAAPFQGISEAGKTTLQLHVKRAGERRNVTFVSNIDGSVQYYALRPAQVPAGVTAKPGIALSLHGASVEASGQAGAYGDKTWCHIVCPTNRRPFGYDWEDWGRLDALEVLNHARSSLDHDPSMLYLTGHSMGGHGTWQLGAHFPSMFAAIAPCAGWRSFYTYGGKRDPEMDDFARIMRRADNPSDTPLLIRNHAQHGVFIVHGDADETVPVAEARAMRDALKEFHKDLHYYEQPGGGHWYDLGDENGDTGADCLDYQPVWDLFARRRVPASHQVREIDFTTISPGISDKCHWAAVWQQHRPFEASRIQLRADPNMHRIVGTTSNVRLLRLDLDSALRKGGKAVITLDGQAIETEWPATGLLWLERGEAWQVVPGAAEGAKNPARYGGFKDAFRNNFIIVYGTGGDAETQQWAAAKARMDAEHFYVRGNGSVEVVSDKELATVRHQGRNVILVGSPSTNSAYELLGVECPIQVQSGKVQIGGKTLTGDLAVLAVVPRPGSDTASIGVISGTSLAGMRLTNRLPYLSSGVGVPDFVVLDARMLRDGASGLRACGYLDCDWQLSDSDMALK
ncbi:MAG: prolyl oligopeptidase family serine peptidase [Planctomycetes bacterium]|nr:prolyl oligopeptidase family serine peptidase [Planctomycetota bacterium]